MQDSPQQRVENQEQCATMLEQVPFQARCASDGQVFEGGRLIRIASIAAPP